MSEAITAIPSEAALLPVSSRPEQGFSSLKLPEVVQKFLETSCSRGGIIIPLTEKRVSLLDSSTALYPFDSFNRTFMQEYPAIFDPHTPRNRIISSYLNPESSIDFSGSVGFTLQPNALARDSAHGVFFGILLSTHSNQSPGIQVAIKPYAGEATSRAYSRAWREFINSHIVLRRGIPTIKPLALVFDDKNAYILSRREKLTALGDVIWEPFRKELGALRTFPDVERFIQTRYQHLIQADPGSGFASPDQQLAQYLITLRNLALCIGQLHLKGIFPQDSQIKNFVAEALTNQVWAIDWENTPITFMNTEASVQDRQLGHEGKKAYYGITQLLLSLLVRKTSQGAEHGIAGIGLFDLYLSNTLKTLREQKPEIIHEMKEISPLLLAKYASPHYSKELLATTDKISKEVIFIFDVLFSQHYKDYLNRHHPNPQLILADEPKFRARMSRHITDILVHDINYYLSL